MKRRSSRRVKKQQFILSRLREKLLLNTSLWQEVGVTPNGVGDLSNQPHVTLFFSDSLSSRDRYLRWPQNDLSSILLHSNTWHDMVGNTQDWYSEGKGEWVPFVEWVGQTGYTTSSFLDFSVKKKTRTGRYVKDPQDTESKE